MRTVWEIYADADGIIIERRASGWRFEPTGKVGRPSTGHVFLDSDLDRNPLDLMRERFDIHRLTCS
jgi:hypothetical protein